MRLLAARPSPVVVTALLALLGAAACDGASGPPTSPPSAPPGAARIVDALSGAPLRATKIAVDGDEGVRCAVAPCPNRTTHWEGVTDGEGFVVLPAASPGLTLTASAVGYQNGAVLAVDAREVRLPPDLLFSFDHAFSAADNDAIVLCIEKNAALRDTCRKAIERNRDRAAALVPGLARLRDSADAEVRAAALAALGAIPGAPPQAPRAGDDLQARYLAAAAETRRLKSPEVPADVARDLMAWLKDAPEEAYRNSDTVWLTWPWRTLLPPLLQVLAEGTEEQRDRASHVVYQIVVLRDAARPGPLGAETSRALLAGLERGPSVVRARAGMALGHLAPHQAFVLPALERLAQSADPDVRESAERGVRTAKDPNR